MVQGKRILTDGRQTIRKDDLHKGVASGKRSVGNDLYIAAKLRLLQDFTSLERTFSDHGHAVRDRHFRQGDKVIESMGANGRQPVFQNHLGYVIMGSIPRCKRLLIVIHGAGACDGQSAVIG